MAEQVPTRRDVLEKAVYIAPMILTLPTFLSFASAGSRNDKPKKDKNKDKGKDKG